MNSNSFNAIERKAAISLASVFALRMLGLFTVLPVLAVLAQDFADYTPALLGFALGAYGLSQAVLQIPFGLLSDRFGRKPLILLGLSLFVLGSVIAALADSLWGVAIGRLLQGSGAIASVILALAADLSRDEQRSKVMAAIGMSIGLAFIVSLVLGPFLADALGLSGLFWLTAFLALAALLVILLVVPTVRVQTRQRDAVAVPAELGKALRNLTLLRLNSGILVLHFVLTAVFVILPNQLIVQGLPLAQHAWLYLAVMLASLVMMIPALILAERRNWQGRTMAAAAVLLAITLAALALADAALASITGWAVAMWLFFAGFNLLEAMFPSMVSRFAPTSAKGTALGVYSTFQFLGAFLGATLAGSVAQLWDWQIVLLISAALLGSWSLFAFGLPVPPQVVNYTLTLSERAREQLDTLEPKLRAMEGVAEVIALPDEGTVYLKVNKRQWSDEALQAVRGLVSLS